MRRAGDRRSPRASGRDNGCFDSAAHRRGDGDQLGQLDVVETGELHTTMLAPFEIDKRGLAIAPMRAHPIRGCWQQREPARRPARA